MVKNEIQKSLGAKPNPNSKLGQVRKWIQEGKSINEVSKLYRSRYNREIPNSYYHKAKVTIRPNFGNSVNRPAITEPVSPISDNQIINEGNPQPQGAIIQGQTYTPEITEAPIQSEGSEIAKNYEENPQASQTPEVLTQEQTNAQVLEVKTPEINQIPQEQTLNLKMFASLPAIFEESIFLLPQVKKMTDNYEPEQEDIDNITKYTEELIAKYDKGTMTKYAQELNFIGAIMVIPLKAFGRKIAEVMSKIGQKKEKPKKQEPELHKEPGTPERTPAIVKEQVQARAREIVQESIEQKRIREQQEYEQKIKEANLTPTADNPTPTLE
jgi:hypothetical protein